MSDYIEEIGNYVTVNEYAKRRGLNPGTVRQKITRGYLPCKRLGTGNRCMILIRANEPWEAHKPGVKKGSKVAHRRSRAEMEEYRKQQAEKDNAPTPQGKWRKIFENPFTNGYVCPFCGHKIQVTEQFLPQVTECEVCGAELNGEGE